MVSPELIFNGSISGFVGVLLGVVISLIVNCTLVEISISGFFAAYFGILFIIVGGIILWRIFSQESTEGLPPGSSKRQPLAAFGILIIVSGVICFTLEQQWYRGTSPVLKVPLYMVLGTSVAFALTFSVVDLVNYVLGFLQVSVAKPFVESASQVHMVLGAALAMGALFGFIFGVLDVEDEVSYQIRLALLREERYCYPVGAILGGAVGFTNEYIRDAEEKCGGRIPSG
eukprot:CAMPEP_0206425640 /NCGR_PEP_ID=MMETSP0324_2-20121206/3908_1 /ASSEMBLY_ACC=CAM_ASM_000836 /TAXON_ID=2866 /ORGANISM="Crypthecodinium cohnii, Strain Seligo" /LENGTH=228 /DNA_ID=CAMNT_0053890453 /DNA_START=58 /DNA_END=740 /DNA_ORIENTATION=+